MRKERLWLGLLLNFFAIHCTYIVGWIFFFFFLRNFVFFPKFLTFCWLYNILTHKLLNHHNFPLQASLKKIKNKIWLISFFGFLPDSPPFSLFLTSSLSFQSPIWSVSCLFVSPDFFLCHGLSTLSSRLSWTQYY